MPDAPKISHRGRIERGPDPDTISGEIKCTITGWGILIRGTKRGAGYDLECELAPVPECVRIPEIDGNA